MKFPDFIIIGATKCGTTALWYNLDKHPDITMARKTLESVEMNFWRGPCWKKGIDWYKSKFSNKSILAGEKSILYIDKKASMKHIHMNIPKCKLILCVRNPVDRAYSNWQMNFKAKKVSDFTIPLFHARYANTGKFYEHIRLNVLPFFDKSQLHICVCEHMKEKPTKGMKNVFDFLDVDDLALPKKTINPILRAKRTREQDVALNKKEKFYRVWSRHKDKISGSMRQELLEYYKPHNEKLFDFLGYEIKEWNR